jgi:heat shock protein HspQ
MKNSLKVLVISTVATFSMQTQCIIDSLSLDRHGEQVICRIGDSHATIYDQDAPGADVERHHTHHIQDLVQSIGQSQLPTTIILESGDMLFKTVRLASLVSKNLQMGAISYLATQAQDPQNYKRKYPHLHFVHADRRTQKVGEFYHIFSYFGTNEIINSFVAPLIQKLSEELKQKLYGLLVGKHIKEAVQLFDKFIQENPQARDYLFEGSHSILSEFASNTKGICPHTLQELFNEAEQAKKELEQMISHLQPQDHYHTFIQNTLQKYGNAITKLNIFFRSISSYRPDQPCVDAICNSLKEKSFAEIYQQWQWAEQSANTLDATLALELSQALQNHHNVIIISGSQHTTNLDELIDRLGCEPLFPSKKDLCPDGLHFTLSEQKLETLFSAIKVMLAHPQPVEQQVKSPAQPCHICQKVTTKNCSRCKKVYYCSRECQAKDWSTHKQICQASEGKK